ncbi:MAG: hypothetical protein C0506_08880 [Anaerolinea sp.]|nr:hypothetical protein [Anaerolinea sp.]
MRDYEFRRSAQDEVLAATDWYIERNPDVADAFLDALKARIDYAMQFPSSGKPETRGCRSLVVGTYPFKMVYRVAGETLEVVAVAHTRRERDYWRDRL